MKAKLLVSACLLGQRVRYDGDSKRIGDDRLSQWQDEGRLVVVCPEVAGGLPTPRPGAQVEGADGPAVHRGEARVLTAAGVDVTPEFVKGANVALKLAQDNDCQIALLKARSPSCGSRRGYDGTHTGNVIDGSGVTAALLSEHGIEVFNEEDLDAVQAALERLDSHD